jgi:PAS domain S-box-containing protein
MSIVTLTEGRYMDVNDSYVQTFGFSREELLGRTTVEMGIIKNEGARKIILQSLEKRRTIKNLEVEFHTRSGRKIEGLLSADKIEIGGQDCLLTVITDITEYRRMQEEIQTLSGLLPICAWCQKLRDDEGYWKSVEQYIGERTKAEFTHGVCPECQRKYFSKINNKNKVN